ncbi:DASH family cryptochrome [Winogradskyella aurantiaca]|uniref:DASH family cryptochrome n=1 Tax=Winogradskyella aurantiaca TaxID=2219558 RepID=UPI000E1DFE2D|nr:DASH family cryptochrome [Winogradskyella aurantiaca]
MQNTTLKTGLIWYRNDLRTRDQQSLSFATNECDRVIALYCIDPRYFETTEFGFKKTEKFRAKFLLETINDLKVQLNQLNIDLFVFHDRPENIIADFCETYEVGALYLQKEWTSEELVVSNKVKNSIQPTIKWVESFDQFLFHPDDINIPVSNIPQVYTVFRKKLEKYVDVRQEAVPAKMPPENRIKVKTQIPQLNDLGFSDYKISESTAFPFNGGGTEAYKRLNNYFFKSKKLGVYKKTRNGLLGKDYSSKFSPWLANGSISAKSIYWQVKNFETSNFKNQSTYWLVFELIWRDYFKYISLKHGNQIFKLEGILKKDYQWSSNPNLVEKWIHGETRSDFVNANMIELKETGWMSNRGRQNVASFFAKDLELDWRIGAAYFESQLLDYDVHSNYGNWMYVAGVGNDPRDRKFNVDLQAERYDSTGKYRRQWLQTTLF